MHIISSYILCYVILYCSAQCWHGRLREPGLPVSLMIYTTPATKQHNAARYNTAQPNAARCISIHDATQRNTVQHNALYTTQPAADDSRPPMKFEANTFRRRRRATRTGSRPGASERMQALRATVRVVRVTVRVVRVMRRSRRWASSFDRRERSAPLRPSSWPAS